MVFIKPGFNFWPRTGPSKSPLNYKHGSGLFNLITVCFDKLDLILIALLQEIELLRMTSLIKPAFQFSDLA